MNKATKIIVILMVMIIVLYTVVGVSKKIENERNNISSGDILNSGDSLLNENEIKISYEVTSGENDVVLKGTSEGSISTTTYTFENEKLVSIYMTEEITSGDSELIENIYNYMKNDEEMSMVYTTVELDGNIITAVLKEEYVDAHGDATKVDIYDSLINSLIFKNKLIFARIILIFLSKLYVLFIEKNISI